MNAIDPHAATRLRIADAAEALFRQIGYQKTSVADIAKECGMSPANVYRFFPSKSAINEAISHRILEVGNTRLDVAGELGQEPDQGFSPFQMAPRALIHSADIEATGARYRAVASSGAISSRDPATPSPAMRPGSTPG